VLEDTITSVLSPCRAEIDGIYRDFEQSRGTKGMNSATKNRPLIPQAKFASCSIGPTALYGTIRQREASAPSQTFKNH
jgi:hypothetical protein